MARLLLTPDSPGDKTPKKKRPAGTRNKCRGCDAWLRTPQITQFPSGPIDILTWGRCRVKMKAIAMYAFGMCIEELVQARLKLAEYEFRRELAAAGVQFSEDTMDRMTEAEVARTLRCSAKTVKRKALAGAFRRLHDGGKVYYLMHEIERYKNGVNIE